MSILTSGFDVSRGFPDGSALGYPFAQKSTVVTDIGEGVIVAVENEGGVAVIDRHTSAAHVSGNLDNPWVVVRGLDETDSETADIITCLKLRTGLMIKIATTETPLPGDLVYANAGVMTIIDPGSAPAFGQVVEFNENEGWMTVES